MAITVENGYQYIPAILSPQNAWGVVFGADGSMKTSSNPFAAYSMEATPSGIYYKAVSKSPGATGAVKIVDLITIPASAWATALRGFRISVFGKHAANTNATTSNVYVGGTGAVGDTNSDGTAIFTDITNSTSGGAIFGQAMAIRTGTSAQACTSIAITQATVLATLSSALTATETSAILVKLTQNAATTATDLPLNWVVELLF